jgi:hypothetical protein
MRSVCVLSTADNERNDILGYVTDNCLFKYLYTKALRTLVSIHSSSVAIHVTTRNLVCHLSWQGLFYEGLTYALGVIQCIDVKESTKPPLK